MHYVYLLKSDKTGEFYVGSTSDLRARFDQHNRAQSISTKHGIPWSLVYYEAFTTKALAIDREKKLKHHGKGITLIKKRAGFR